MTPRVSVVMPVLRPHPEWFREAVGSVLGQTLRDWELIVVEAASESPAGPLLDRDPRIVHVMVPQPTSLVEQRNRGLREARAPLVAMLDADDLARPERLAVQAAYLDAHPEVSVVGAQLEVIDGQGKRIGGRRYPVGHDAIVRAMALFNPLAQSAVMARREALLAAGGYGFAVENTGEDYDLWSRLARDGRRFATVDQPLCAHRVHGEGSKAARLRAHLRSTLAVKRAYWSREQGLRGRARMAAERLLLHLPPALVLRAFMLVQVR